MAIDISISLSLAEASERGGAVSQNNLITEDLYNFITEDGIYLILET